MKILVLQESDWVERGPHQSHHLMERMQQRGHQVRVIDFEIGWRSHPASGRVSGRKVFPDVHKVLEDGTVTVIRPAFVRFPVLDYASASITHFIEIRRQLREFRPDIIMGFGIMNAATGIWLARRHGIPFVYYIIDELHKLMPLALLRGLSKVVEEGNLRRSSLVLSINEALRDYTIEMGAPPERARVLRAGIDLERYLVADGSAIRRRYGLEGGDLVLFFMGWLYPFSGLKEVAEELIEDQRGPVKVKLLVVGRGELWETLQRLAASKGASDRIITVSWRSYSELPAYLAAADLCLLPAYKNDIMRNIVPIKMYEYMAAGKAVIATRLYGLEREFGEGHGVVYIDDPREAVGRARELKAEGNLPALGKEARDFAAKSDWTRITSDLERLLLKCVMSGSPPPARQ